MTPITYIEKGIANYIDQEVLSKFPSGTWQKVAIGSVVALAIHKYANALTGNKFLRSIELVDDHGADIVAYAEHLKKTMPEAGVTIEIPMLGEVILKASDVDDILGYINKAERGY